MHIVERIVEQNLGVYRASPTRLREDVQQEAQVASDYRGRLAYELLQNADDAMEGAATHRDHVKFLLTEDALWMANNGRPLSDQDVQGLCGLGASSKVDASGNRRASIGHKGLGFKSVLEITERPAAMSEGIAFELSEETARRRVAPVFDELGIDLPTSLPVMRFPDLLTGEMPEWARLRDQGFTTAFRFPFRPDMRGDRRDRLAENLRSLTLTTVLFLKHLDQVEVAIETEGQDQVKSWQLTREIFDGGEWRSSPGLSESGMYRVEVSSTDGDSGVFLVAHDADVEIGDHRSGLTGPAWAGVTLAEVSVAVLDPTQGREEMPSDWRRFHVFLPTGEPSPYPILINGAFATDISRQAVRINEDDTHDYNHHLIRHSAALFAEQVLPVIADQGMEHVVATLDRDRDLGDATAVALHRAMAREVRRVPLLPTNDGALLTLDKAVFPPADLEHQGSEFRSLLVDEASWQGRTFPSASICTGRWSRVGADHGAVSLDAPDAVTALAGQLDAEAAVAVEHESGGFELDPVLEICAAIYLSADRDDRPEVQKRARSERLFPTVLKSDGTFDRVNLEGETAFYPPRSARHYLPLGGLQFMAHPLCWGALLPNERNDVLGERLHTWTLLFDVQEFRFEVVMREAVLPHLRIRGREHEDDHQSDLATMETLAAICQLAGRFPKPDRPLRYQRLGTDRALFNLSRLPVPCRGAEGETVRWVPAYRAYFGNDWIGRASAEVLTDALSSSGAPQALHLPFLLPPREFLGRLEDAPAEDELAESEAEGDEDEVDLDEDFDKSLESDERSVWMAFLKWIGVNDVLRPVHFHDVEDQDSGWLTTSDLVQPKGWAFANLGDVWEEYRSTLLAAHPRLQNEDLVPYLYELHDLEGLVAILAAAERDASGEIGRTLLEHLVQHWETLDHFAETTLALVQKGLYPSQRTKPPRPKSEEVVQGGDNFWLYRLKSHSHFPTSHGPRRPDQSWLMSQDIERRFGRRGQTASELMPVFQLDSDLPERQITAVATRLGVRNALTPATFTLEDAQLLCRRLDELFDTDDLEDTHLRDVIRPAYRELFELLAGRSSDPDSRGFLETEPLLVELSGSYSFRQASQVLYSGTPGFLQRSGLRDRIATFVLEAEPSVNAPLSQLFGVRTLEDSIDWLPEPGESPFEDDDYSDFRSGLEALAPLILARVRVERSRQQDGRILRDFVDRLEPVDELGLTCRIDGEAHFLGNSREYYVRRADRNDLSQVFIVWGGQPWPPEPDEAQRLAMALADALEVNLVEAFLALIQSEWSQQQRLLEIAGAVRFVDEARAELQSPDSDPVEVPAADLEGRRTVSPIDEPTEESPATMDETKPASPPVELVRFEDLWIGGEPVVIHGEVGDHDRDGYTKERSTGGEGNEGSRAAPGTDLVSLDELGMRIAFAYEVNRLKKRGIEQPGVIPADLPHSTSRHLVINASTPGAISRAKAQSATADAVFQSLQEMGVSQVHPGFDILTVIDGEVDRIIELKSSAVDARVQAMTWNEWKSARNSELRERFWLYLVGSLRVDLPSPPYLRAIRDPFGNLYSEEVSAETVSRAVQLRVREFEQAEHLFLVRDVDLESDT